MQGANRAKNVKIRKSTFEFFILKDPIFIPIPKYLKISTCHVQKRIVLIGNVV